MRPIIERLDFFALPFSQTISWLHSQLALCCRRTVFLEIHQIDPDADLGETPAFFDFGDLCDEELSCIHEPWEMMLSFSGM